MTARLTKDEKSLLARLLEEEDADESDDTEQNDPEHGDDSDDVDEVTYKGKRYRRIADDEDEPQPVKKTARQTNSRTKTASESTPEQSPTPRKRRFVT